MSASSSPLPVPPERLLVIADGVSATQHISFLQPLLGALSAGRIGLRLEPHTKTKKVLLDALSDAPTLLVLSRCTWRSGRSIVDSARKRGIPTLFHIDDDLLNVPESLGPEKYAAYNDPERLASLRDNMESCDLLYASTQALGATLKAHGLKVPIRSGTIYCTVDPAGIRPPLPSTMPTIGYMGTGGHSEDLAMVLPAIERLMDAIPALRFETFGTITPPPSLARFDSRYAHHAPVGNYAAFVAKLSSLGWWVGLAPLVDNPFNLCKADTKWVEYTYAGIPTIASDLPVYQPACAAGAGLLASTAEDWHGAMRRLLQDPLVRKRQMETAQARLRTSYTHEALEQQLLAVIEDARARASGKRP